MPPVKGGDMNPTLTPCQQRLERVLPKFRAALLAAERLTDAASADERESADAAVCLTSRSSFLGFYTWVTLHRRVDEAAELELDELFGRAVAVMTTPDLRESVSDRYEEFKDLCDRTPRGQTSGVYLHPTTIEERP